MARIEIVTGSAAFSDLVSHDFRAYASVTRKKGNACCFWSTVKMSVSMMLD
jgi:hypothetical protein